ncbi:MAG: DivIVA domain-containing protein [Myxococcota bacterium]|nr:DivIVA domain-containing protein [Myxococcota bacterium]
MRVTPLDIIQKQFAPARRGGVESDEVREFLDQVRESMETLLKENQGLRDELGRKDSEIADLRDKESDIKTTLMLARQVKDDMERGARREADVIVGEARLEAERILMAASEERRELQADLVRLRSGRAKLLADLRGVLDSYARVVAEMEQEAPAAR